MKPMYSLFVFLLNFNWGGGCLYVFITTQAHTQCTYVSAPGTPHFYKENIVFNVSSKQS